MAAVSESAYEILSSLRDELSGYLIEWATRRGPRLEPRHAPRRRRAAA